MDDPWKHRSFGMICHTCMWFAAKKVLKIDKKIVGGVEHNVEESVDGPIGRCRRHAPTMNGYPVVYPNDWCGDHKLNENRVVSDIVDEKRLRELYLYEERLNKRDAELDLREAELGEKFSHSIAVSTLQTPNPAADIESNPVGEVESEPVLRSADKFSAGSNRRPIRESDRRAIDRFGETSVKTEE